MVRILQWPEAMRIQNWQWLISCAVFAAILMAFVIAAMLEDPLASILP